MCTPCNQVHIPNGTSIGSAVFAQLTAEGPYTIQCAAPPSKLPLLVGYLDPRLVYVVPWVHRSPYPKRHLDRFSGFAGLTIVTDRPTDRPTDHAPTSVTIGRMYMYIRPHRSTTYTYCTLYVVLRCGLIIIIAGVIKANSQNNGNGQISNRMDGDGPETPKRISMKRNLRCGRHTRSRHGCIPNMIQVQPNSAASCDDNFARSDVISQAPERTYTTTDGSPCGAAATWVVSANT